MINLLREVLNDIVICIDTGDYPAVMRETVCFTVLFEQFLRRAASTSSTMRSKASTAV
ncbi:hypothetical protein Pmgp_01864 [Pelotomaculum propionicicum]|uniref:Uncharacterized protein n=1 Tax=Pelotomaculum propionicicum TaxID=258475 RepID=A0A4Y7RQ73_9FIRM|nr:hypothetical protein Pmgp_01864 [Pelotomaculum propionicicum]